MARQILCPKCNEKYAALAQKYREYFESIEGKAKSDFRCDSCDISIKKEDACFGAAILPTKNHFQYENHKPSAWIGNIITPNEN